MDFANKNTVIISASSLEKMPDGAFPLLLIAVSLISNKNPVSEEKGQQEALQLK